MDEIQKTKNVEICIIKKCSSELPTGAIFCPVCGRRQQQEPKKYRKRSNGSGTVYKKTDGHRKRPWIAEKDGIVVGRFETRTEAQKLIDSLTDKTVTDRFNATFAEVYEHWKSEHFRKLKSDKGREGYETAYDHYSELHERKFRELRHEDYQKPIDELVKRGRSHSCVNKLKELVGQLCKWAIREHISDINYGSTLIMPEQTKKDKTIFSKAERDLIDKAAKTRDEAKLVKIMNNTGMRIGELFSLKTENIHDKYCIGGEKTEAGRDRIIPIPPEIRKEFAYFKDRAFEKPLLIDGYEGNRDIRNFRNRDYYQLLEDLGIEKKSPHTCRRTYATMARLSGMPPEILQKILGHADYNTTATDYIVAEKEIDRLIQAAENINKKKTKKEKTAK